MLHEKIEEIIRERFPGGTALEELATLQLVTSLTGQQTMDASTILPLLLLGGGGGSSLRGPSGRVALLALAMMMSQQNQGSRIGCAGDGSAVNQQLAADVVSARALRGTSVSVPSLALGGAGGRGRT